MLLIYTLLCYHGHCFISLPIIDFENKISLIDKSACLPFFLAIWSKTIIWMGVFVRIYTFQTTFKPNLMIIAIKYT